MNAIAHDRLDEIGGGINPSVQPLPTPVILPADTIGKLSFDESPPIEILPVLDRY
ncbi:MAG: hypothetical protein ABI411_10760 [Tahibacter sp.]